MMISIIRSKTNKPHYDHLDKCQDSDDLNEWEWMQHGNEITIDRK